MLYKLSDLPIAAALSMAIMPMAAAALPPSNPMAFCRPFAPQQPPRRDQNPMTPCHACMLCSSRTKHGGQGDDDDAG